MGKSLSYLRKDFNYLCHINVEEWHKMYRQVSNIRRTLVGHYDVKSQSFNPGLQYPHLHGPVHTPDNNRWDTPPV